MRKLGSCFQVVGNILILFLYALVAQLDRALVYETNGWGFDFLRAHQESLCLRCSGTTQEFTKLFGSVQLRAEVPVSICLHSETDIIFRFERKGAGSTPAGDTIQEDKDERLSCRLRPCYLVRYHYRWMYHHRTLLILIRGYFCFYSK